MKRKNNGLTGQGFAHPENEQQLNFAALIPVISGVVGRQSTSEVNNSQSPAAKRTPFQQDISLKNAHGASRWKAGNPVEFYPVGFSRCLLVVIGNSEERPEKREETFSPSAEKYAVRTFLESIKKSADCGHALWVSSAEYFADVKSAKNLADHFSPFNCLASCCAMPTSSLRWSPACTPISPMRSSASSAPLRLVKSLSSPFSLSWRREISPCMAVTMNCPVLSSWRFTASIPSITSWGILAVTDCDLVFLEPVAIGFNSCSWCKTVYTKNNYIKALTCKTLKNKNAYTNSGKCFAHENDKQHYQHIDRSPVHAFHHQHWRHSYGLAGRRKHSISNCDAGAFQGSVCASCHENWWVIKTAKPGSVGALNRASNQQCKKDLHHGY